MCKYVHDKVRQTREAACAKFPVPHWLSAQWRANSLSIPTLNSDSSSGAGQGPPHFTFSCRGPRHPGWPGAGRGARGAVHARRGATRVLAGTSVLELVGDLGALHRSEPAPPPAISHPERPMRPSDNRRHMPSLWIALNTPPIHPTTHIVVPSRMLRSLTPLPASMDECAGSQAWAHARLRVRAPGTRTPGAGGGVGWGGVG